MRVLAISGSPRSGGNTEIAVRTALEVLAAEGIEGDFLSLVGRQVKPCRDCGGCAKSKKIECVQPDPAFEGVIERCIAADGILVASRLHSSTTSS